MTEAVEKPAARRKSTRSAKPAVEASAAVEAAPRKAASRKKSAPVVVEAAPVVVEAAPVVVEAAPVVVVAAPPAPPRRAAHREIALRAFALYRAGSRDTFANWMRAERELQGA